MSKSSSRAARRQQSAKPLTRRARLGARIRAIPPHVALTVSVIGIIALSAVLLITAAVSTMATNDWHTVATVNGEQISRAELRARIALDASLDEQLTAAIRTLTNAGRIDEADARNRQSALETLGAVDPVSRALDGLISDALIRQGAKDDGVSVTALAAADAVVAYLGDSLSRRLAWVSLSLPPSAPGQTSGDYPPAPGPDDLARDKALEAVIAKAQEELLAGQTPQQVVEHARAAGWLGAGHDTWISARGDADGLPAEVLTSAREIATAKRAITPVTDPVSGATYIAVVSDLDGGPSFGTTDGLDASVLAKWAQARALEPMILTKLTADLSKPVVQRRASELVVGRGDIEGEPADYRGLAHLVLSQVTGTSGEALRDELNALPADERVARWAKVVADANALPATDPLLTSGELGFHTSDELLPQVAAAIFGADVKPDTVVGPITTNRGPELFLVRTSFEGVLDDATNAAATRALTVEDPASFIASLDPAMAGRVDGSPWRTATEFAEDDPARAALFETPIGERAGPVVMNDQLVVVIPLEEVTRAPDTAMIARLSSGLLQTWFDARRKAASVVIDADNGAIPNRPIVYRDSGSGDGGVSTDPSGVPMPSIPVAPTPFIPAAPTAPVPVLPTIPTGPVLP